jgi:hypothetical protein
MDFALENKPQGDAKADREAIILACASQRAENHWCAAAAVDNWIDDPEAYTLMAGGLPVNRLWARANARQQRMQNTRNVA